MIEIEINGQKVQANDGDTIIEAADREGIYIPRFCYHKKLSIAANCRMCLVEVVGGRKPVPACATPVTADTKVLTQSKAALEAQRIVMEFLLINHPLDCPICDQGGECELQDMSMGYGRATSQYTESKRAVQSEDIGPLIETEMTRCIHCTRCVRFGEEVAGLRELGVTFRGEHSEIGTYVKHFLHSELSGNVIDLCPVGALTAKPSRYRGRAWELHEHATVAPHDCVGANIFVHTRGQEYSPEKIVMRVVPRENESINQVWATDRDRFSYEALYHTDRVYKPMIKRDGQWQESDWQRALLEVAGQFSLVAEHQGAEQIAGIASANCTIEEYYLLQKLMRSLGSPHVDYRLQELDLSDQDQYALYPGLDCSIAELEEMDAVLLIGSNLRFEQPLLAQRVYQAAEEGAAVLCINPVAYPFVFKVTEALIDREMVLRLAEVARAVADLKQQVIVELQEVVVGEVARKIAATLCQAEKAVILLGEFALHHSQAAELRALAQLITTLTQANLGLLTKGANAAGAWLAGAVPHRGAMGSTTVMGKTAKELLSSDPVRAYLLLNTEPEFDCQYSAKALATLKQAGLVVCITPFVTPLMREYADIILPMAPFAENAGTFVNVTGEWQSFVATSVPHGEARPAWKILRVLANFLQLDDFHYKNSQEIRTEMEGLLLKAPQKSAHFTVKVPTVLPAELVRIASYPMYRVDNLVRRAKALQETQCFLNEVTDAIVMHENTAKRWGVEGCQVVVVRQQEQSLILPLNVDNTVAEDVAILPAGIPLTAGFGQHMQAITVERSA